MVLYYPLIKVDNNVLSGEMGVKIPFSFSSKQNEYLATDQINVMKLRLPRCKLIAVNMM